MSRFRIEKEPRYISPSEIARALETENDGTVIDYVIRRLWDSGVREVDDEDVAEQCKQLLIDYALEKLVQKGLLSYTVNNDGDKEYQLTETGQQIRDSLLSEENGKEPKIEQNEKE